MPEYIDKDKLLSDIECVDISDCTDIDNIFTEIERTIDDQPTADVAEVKHGEWIKQQGCPEASCSECGRDVVYQIIDNHWEFANFCPNCGAKMDKE